MCSMLYYEPYVTRSIKDREKMHDHIYMEFRVGK